MSSSTLVTDINATYLENDETAKTVSHEDEWAISAILLKFSKEKKCTEITRIL
jgi:hypothetical protein